MSRGRLRGEEYPRRAPQVGADPPGDEASASSRAARATVLTPVLAPLAPTTVAAPGAYAYDAAADVQPKARSAAEVKPFRLPSSYTGTSG